MGFNHYKTSCLDPTLNEIDTFLRNILLAIGFLPTAWRKVTDLQILKKIGVFHVDKMRCIQLMDTEFNIANKDLSRRALAHAEKANAVAPDQYGCRKTHKAINACLNKVLLNDLLRQKRHCGAIAMNDAKGCFDR